MWQFEDVDASARRFFVLLSLTQLISLVYAADIMMNMTLYYCT